jgi:hypothetical protein
LPRVERFERLHKPGHLRRVHVLAERLQDMHDANFTGQKASQSQVHAWFVLDRDYCGPACRSTRLTCACRGKSIVAR